MKLLRLAKLTLEELDARGHEFNRIAQQCSDLDRFCSSTHWIIPAHQAFANIRPTWILRSEAGYVALAVGYRLSHGIVLEPLESVWGLACPFVSPDPATLVQEFAWEHVASRKARIPLLLSGLRRDGELFNVVCRAFAPRMHISLGRSLRSFRASLEGGVDGFLSRRSPGFRANLRRSQRLAQAAGLQFEYHAGFTSWLEVCRLYERIIRIEALSWKGQAGTGLNEPAMEDFYRLMLERVWKEDAVRAVIARSEGQDVGFVFGAVFHGSYRGLQVSFDERFSRMSLGNLLQWEMISRLCQEGCSVYDLGVEVPYKERWAEDVLETVQLMVL